MCWHCGAVLSRARRLFVNSSWVLFLRSSPEPKHMSVATPTQGSLVYAAAVAASMSGASDRRDGAVPCGAVAVPARFASPDEYIRHLQAQLAAAEAHTEAALAHNAVLQAENDSLKQKLACAGRAFTREGTSDHARPSVVAAATCDAGECPKRLAATCVGPHGKANVISCRVSPCGAFVVSAGADRRVVVHRLDRVPAVGLTALCSVRLSAPILCAAWRPHGEVGGDKCVHTHACARLDGAYRTCSPAPRLGLCCTEPGCWLCRAWMLRTPSCGSTQRPRHRPWLQFKHSRTTRSM